MENCYLFAFVMDTVLCGLLCLFGLAGNTFTTAILSRHSIVTCCPLPLQCLLLFDCMTLWLVWIRSSGPGLALVSTVLRDCDDVCSYTRIITEPLLFLAQSCSTWLTLLLTMERWQAVSSRQITLLTAPREKHTQHRVAAIFVVCSVLMIPKTFDSLVITSKNSNSSVAAQVLADNHYYNIIYNNIIIYMAVFAVAYILMCYYTIRLFIFLCSNQILSLAKAADSEYDNIVHVTQVSAVLGATYVVSYFPVHALKITQVLQATQQQYACAHFQYFLQGFVNFFLCVNAALKFCIMLLFVKKLRQVIRVRYCCRAKPDHHRDLKQIYQCADSSEMTTILSLHDDVSQIHFDALPGKNTCGARSEQFEPDYDASCRLIVDADVETAHF